VITYEETTELAYKAFGKKKINDDGREQCGASTSTHEKQGSMYGLFSKAMLDTREIPRMGSGLFFQ